MMITTQTMHLYETPHWTAPPQSNDTSSLKEGLFATFAAEQFNCKVIGNRFVEAYAGEHVELYCTVSCLKRSLELVRKPPGSAAEMLATRPFRIICDRPGLFVLRLTLEETWVREVCVAAFPREVDKRLGYPDPKQAKERRMRLRSIVRDARVTRESVISSLESDDEMFGMGGRIVAQRTLEEGSSATGDGAFSVGSYFG